MRFTPAWRARAGLPSHRAASSATHSCQLRSPGTCHRHCFPYTVFEQLIVVPEPDLPPLHHHPHRASLAAGLRHFLGDVPGRLCLSLPRFILTRSPASPTHAIFSCLSARCWGCEMKRSAVVLRFFGALEGAAGSTGNQQQSQRRSWAAAGCCRSPELTTGLRLGSDNSKPWGWDTVTGKRPSHFTEPVVLKFHGQAEFGHHVPSWSRSLPAPAAAAGGIWGGSSSSIEAVLQIQSPGLPIVASLSPARQWTRLLRQALCHGCTPPLRVTDGLCSSLSVNTRAVPQASHCSSQKSFPGPFSGITPRTTRLTQTTSSDARRDRGSKRLQAHRCHLQGGTDPAVPTLAKSSAALRGRVAAPDSSSPLLNIYLCTQIKRVDQERSGDSRQFE